MNAFIIVKILTSACIIVLVSEIARKHTALGGLIAAMPITTVLSMLWIYYENKNIGQIQDFLASVVGGTILSFIFFIAAIILFKKGVNFYAGVVISLIVLGIGAAIYRKYF